MHCCISRPVWAGRARAAPCLTRARARRSARARRVPRTFVIVWALRLVSLYGAAHVRFTVEIFWYREHPATAQYVAYIFEYVLI